MKTKKVNALAKAYDPDRQGEFVIKYTFKPMSYFTQMTRIGPQFGAKLKDTPRYPTPLAAGEVIYRMGMIGIGAEVYEILPAPNDRSE